MRLGRAGRTLEIHPEGSLWLTVRMPRLDSA